MTTATVRDAWADAHAAATQDVLDPDVARLRLRIWLRRAAVVAVEIAALLAALLLVERLVDPTGEGDTLWPVALGPGIVLVALGLAFMAVGTVRSIGVGTSFVGPEDFLPRTERSWLRAQLTANRPVPEERRVVVATVARRTVAESRSVPIRLGYLLALAGMVVVTGSRLLLVSFAVVTVVAVTVAVLALVRARRARRWLAANA